MPSQPTTAYILADALVHKQALFNAGKIVEKTVQEKKSFIAAMLDITAGDAATIVRDIRSCQNPDEVENKARDIIIQIGYSNIIDTEDNRAVFVAGYASACKIKEVNDHLEKAEAAKRRASIPRSIFGININRGGHQVLTVDTDSIHSEWSLNKIIGEIYKRRRWIIFSVIIGSVLYIVFKKPKFLRKFFNRIKKLSKPFSKTYKAYKKISNHWLIRNRVTKSLFVLYRVTNHNVV